MGGVLAGFGAGRDAQLQRRLTPCVYDEQPRLPVGLAVGAADQAPRACDSARGLTGKERAISRFVAPGPRVRIHLPPAASRVRTSIRSIALITSRIESTLIRRRSVADAAAGRALGRGIRAGLTIWVRAYCGSRADFEAMNRAIVQHRLRPVIDRTFPFAEANAAYRHFEGRGHFGKVVITHG